MDTGCFHFLATMNAAAIDIHVHVLACTYVLILLGKYPGVELLGCIVNLCLIFKEPHSYFPMWQHLIVISPAACEGPWTEF